MNSIKYWVNFLGGAYRLMLGFCPLCNSDAPELYNCPCCEWYSSKKDSTYPVPVKIKKEWWDLYLSAIKFKRQLRTTIKRAKLGVCVHCGVHCTGKTVFCTSPLDDKKRS